MKLLPCIAAAAFLLVTVSVPAASPTVPDSLISYATMQSLGFEWNITGDTNHNALCAVQYRKLGAGQWTAVQGLFRVDYLGSYDGVPADRAYNMLAGSILFLDPGATYEVRLDLTDPDGGSTSRTVSIATRPVPALGTNPRTVHVTPGSGGGSGTSIDPWRGITAAEAAAAPGDVVLMHAGSYGFVEIDASGTASAYRAWKAAGDGDVMIDSMRVFGSHVWLEGLTVRKTPALIGGRGLIGENNVTDVVVTRCSFTGCNYSITLKDGCANWYICDNTIVGDKATSRVSDFGGEGVELNYGTGHVVAYNSISLTADGVSYARRNCDIHNNDIFNVTDDGIEPDYGYANVRMWENRITNPFAHGISFQPMYCGPWYIIRNQVMGGDCAILKYRVQDRFLLVNNTFVAWNTMQAYGHHILTSLSRNNLWIQGGGSGYIWEGYECTEPLYCITPDRFSPDWRSDVDYDGFDWGTSTYPFKWNLPVERYSDLTSFVADVGIETHGKVVDKAAIFESFPSLPADTLLLRANLTLRTGSAAVNAGVVVPGINDRIAVGAPDLGAFELGADPPQFGPRAGGLTIRGEDPGIRRRVAPPRAFDPTHVRWVDARGAAVPAPGLLAGSRATGVYFGVAGRRVTARRVVTTP